MTDPVLMWGANVEIDGYLMAALKDMSASSDKLGVVVIDEPESFSNHDLLCRQATVLSFAVTNQWPVWFITLQDKPAHSTLAKAAQLAVTFTKPRGNAFEVPEFVQAVKVSGVHRLVVMGHESNMCVRLTVVTGKWKSLDPDEIPTKGAVDHGYEVLTCQNVLSGGPANWKDASSSIKFYKGLKVPPPVPSKPKK